MGRPGPESICKLASPDRDVTSLSDYFAVIDEALRGREDVPVWFRGHADQTWKLIPSLLRLRTIPERQVAVRLLDEFRRRVEHKISFRSPAEHSWTALHWMQIAQHYGMKTRLLDWTSNAAVALYFCCQHADRDGAVFILDPLALNATFHRERRVFTAISDMQLLKRYLGEPLESKSDGLTPVAINPIWDNERIALQHGCFTLHGSKYQALTERHTPGMSHIPIARKMKPKLLRQLRHIGVGEMFIFPEPEHVSRHLLELNRL